MSTYTNINAYILGVSSEATLHDFTSLFNPVSLFVPNCKESTFHPKERVRLSKGQSVIVINCSQVVVPFLKKKQIGGTSKCKSRIIYRFCESLDPILPEFHLIFEVDFSHSESRGDQCHQSNIDLLVKVSLLLFLKGNGQDLYLGLQQLGTIHD